MDAFSYLSVLLSIILGLAIAQVLQGYRAVLLARRRVRLSSPVLIWSGLVLLFATQAWWASFGLRDRAHWDFLSFAIILLQMILLYMLSAVVFPEIGSDDRVDLVDHFDRHRKIFYGFLIAMLLVSILKDLVLSHHLPEPENLAFHAAFAATALAGISIANRRIQTWIALIGAAEFLLYIALLFAKLAF
jgi:hypothetical protein